MKDLNIKETSLSPEEQRKMRRKHFIVIPVILIGALVTYVMYKFESLPTPARWAGAVIAILAVIIFISKHLKLERELKEGVVHEIQGAITQKKKLGGGKKYQGGLTRTRSGGGSITTFKIAIDEKNFVVPARIYGKVNEGDTVVMRYFQQSQFIISIEKK